MVEEVKAVVEHSLYKIVIEVFSLKKTVTHAAFAQSFWFVCLFVCFRFYLFI